MAEAAKSQIDHEGLFKQLLTVFFIEFVQSFLPDVAKYLDPTYIEFLDKETFGGARSRRRREADLVVKVRFLDRTEAFFLIHVENQSSHQNDFPERMHRYFNRLTEKYGLPVYPVAILSYDAPMTPAPTRYEMTFPDLDVLRFQYKVIQLNRLPWRRFVKQPNPAATALMAKMRISPGDRPKVKAECLRLLATLKLTPEKSELIYVFIERYLQLTSEENRIYERQLDKFEPEVKETTMEIISSIRQEGRQEGKEELVALQLQQRFSTLPPSTTEKLDSLTSDQLNELGLELFKFQSLAELEEWLARR